MEDSEGHSDPPYICPADTTAMLAGGRQRVARPLYARDPIGVDLDQSLYALDSTTIDLCLSLFPWPPKRGKPQS